MADGRPGGAGPGTVESPGGNLKTATSSCRPGFSWRYHSHKLFISPAGRYSEDIDLVQVAAGPIGAILDAIREALDPWLGEPRWRRGHDRVSLIYRFETTAKPVQQMKLKIEINTREHFSVLRFGQWQFLVKSSWFSGEAHIKSYQLDELLGTKLRALFQRRKSSSTMKATVTPSEGLLGSIKTSFPSIASERSPTSKATCGKPIWSATVRFHGDCPAIMLRTLSRLCRAWGKLGFSSRVRRHSFAASPHFICW